MRIVYFRQKKSGNFELSNKKDHTVKFNSVTKLKNWFNNSYTYPDNCLNKGHGKVIKANYRLSQTYCFNFQDVRKLADI
jgi:hypothetical protein